MFTIVKDTEYIAFTMVSDPSNVHLLVQRFEELAPEWGIGSSRRIALALRELLSNAILLGGRRDGSRKVRCWVERTPEGPFKITVEDESGGGGFGLINTGLPDDSRNGHRRSHDLIRKICRNLQFNMRGNRVTVFVDAAEDDEMEQ